MNEVIIGASVALAGVALTAVLGYHFWTRQQLHQQRAATMREVIEDLIILERDLDNQERRDQVRASMHRLQANTPLVEVMFGSQVACGLKDLTTKISGEKFTLDEYDEFNNLVHEMAERTGIESVFGRDL